MSEETKKPITVHVTLGRKVNLGNYESADVNIGIAGIPAGATDEDIEKALTTAGLAFKSLREELKARVREVEGNRADREYLPAPRGD